MEQQEYTYHHQPAVVTSHGADVVVGDVNENPMRTPRMATKQTMANRVTPPASIGIKSPGSKGSGGGGNGGRKSSKDRNRTSSSSPTQAHAHHAQKKQSPYPAVGANDDHHLHSHSHPHHYENDHHRTSSSSSSLAYPTELHRACASPASTPSQLRAHLLARPNAASMRDRNGRLPLHVLANRLLYASSSSSSSSFFGPSNAMLEESLLNDEMRDFVMELVRAYPLSIVTSEDFSPTSANANSAPTNTRTGKIPFSNILVRWIECCHTNASFYNAEAMRPVLSPPGNRNGNEDYGNDSDGEYDDYEEERTLDTRSTLTLPTVFRSEASSFRKSRHNHRRAAAAAAANAAAGASNNASAHNGQMRKNHHRPRVQIVSAGNDGASLAGRSTRSQNRGGRAGGSVGSRSRGGREGKQLDPSGVGGAAAVGGASGGTSSGGDGDGGGDALLYPMHNGYESIMMYEDLFPTSGMVYIPPIVEYTFSLLNDIDINFRERISDLRYHKVVKSYLDDHVEEEEALRDILSTLVETLSSMPSLVKTLLLLDDNDSSKHRMLNLPLVQKVLHNPNGVGDWLVYMLECVDESVCRCAVRYLRYLSLPSSSGNASAHEDGMKTDPFEEHHEKIVMYQRVGQLPYLVHSILALDDSSTQYEASSSGIVRYAMDMSLSTKSSGFIALLDLIFHLLLIVTFTLSTNAFLEKMSTSAVVTDVDMTGIEGDGSGSIVDVDVGGTRNNSYVHQTHGYLSVFLLTLLCELYFILRILIMGRSMHKISPSCFIIHCFKRLRMWVDVSSIGMALSCTIVMDIFLMSSNGGSGVNVHFRHALAATCGLLWWKLLLFLGRVNIHVSAMNGLLAQILLDLRYLLLFLILSIAAFAQMFFVALSSASNDDVYPIQSYYLSVYSLLLGNYDLDNFTNPFSVVLFAILTCTMAFVVMNAFIASAVDTYQRWRSRDDFDLWYTNNDFGNSLSGTAEHHNHMMFGSNCGGVFMDDATRLAFVAEVKAITNLFRGGLTPRAHGTGHRWTLMQYCAVILFVASIGVVFLLCIGTVRSAMSMYYGNDVVIIGLVVLLIFVCISVVAFLSHMNFHESGEEMFHHETGGGKDALQRSKKDGEWCVRKLCTKGPLRWIAMPAIVLIRWLLSLNGIGNERGNFYYDSGSTRSRMSSASGYGGGGRIFCYGTDAADNRRRPYGLGITTLATRAINERIMCSERRNQQHLMKEIKRLQHQMKDWDGNNRIDVLMELRASENRMQGILKALASRKEFGGVSGPSDGAGGAVLPLVDDSALGGGAPTEAVHIDNSGGGDGAADADDEGVFNSLVVDVTPPQQQQRAGQDGTTGANEINMTDSSEF